MRDASLWDVSVSVNGCMCEARFVALNSLLFDKTCVKNSIPLMEDLWRLPSSMTVLLFFPPLCVLKALTECGSARGGDTGGQQQRAQARTPGGVLHVSHADEQEESSVSMGYARAPPGRPEGAGAGAPAAGAVAQPHSANDGTVVEDSAFAWQRLLGGTAVHARLQHRQQQQQLQQRQGQQQGQRGQREQREEREVTAVSRGMPTGEAYRGGAEPAGRADPRRNRAGPNHQQPRRQGQPQQGQGQGQEGQGQEGQEGSTYQGHMPGPPALSRAVPLPAAGSDVSQGHIMGPPPSAQALAGGLGGASQRLSEGYGAELEGLEVSTCAGGAGEVMGPSGSAQHALESDSWRDGGRARGAGGRGADREGRGGGTAGSSLRWGGAAAGGGGAGTVAAVGAGGGGAAQPSSVLQGQERASDVAQASNAHEEQLESVGVRSDLGVAGVGAGVDAGVESDVQAACAGISDDSASEVGDEAVQGGVVQPLTGSFADDVACTGPRLARVAPSTSAGLGAGADTGTGAGPSGVRKRGREQHEGVREPVRTEAARAEGMAGTSRFRAAASELPVVSRLAGSVGTGHAAEWDGGAGKRRQGAAGRGVASDRPAAGAAPSAVPAVSQVANAVAGWHAHAQTSTDACEASSPALGPARKAVPQGQAGHAQGGAPWPNGGGRGGAAEKAAGGDGTGGGGGAGREDRGRWRGQGAVRPRSRWEGPATPAVAVQGNDGAVVAEDGDSEDEVVQQPLPAAGGATAALGDASGPASREVPRGASGVKPGPGAGWGAGKHRPQASDSRADVADST